jgi:hypothetical protein
MLGKINLNKIKKYINSFDKVDWRNLRSVNPVSTVFGIDRGTPIDRYYIEKFLSNNKQFIRGNVLEIAENVYSKKFAQIGANFEILHATKDNPKATIIGDLTDPNSLPENKIDCFICTQTLNFIYDFKKAIEGSYYLLKKDGVMLATLAGITQISRYDMERWGDYWRFTTLSAQKAFGEVFGLQNVEVNCYGNVLASIALLEGISSEELTQEELDYTDDNYQITITIRATK